MRMIRWMCGVSLKERQRWGWSDGYVVFPWKKDRDEDDQVDVWCFPERKTEMRMIRWMCPQSFPERKTAQHWTEKTPRCRRNWGCYEKRWTEVTSMDMWKETTMPIMWRNVLGWWWRGRRLLAGRRRSGRTICLQTCVCWKITPGMSTIERNEGRRMT